ncbi:choice-of-anchor A family protein [Dyadobacter psychrophilus]|uniref:Por secretion system C-terminal sorting domain-containing protein/choice-of-anchor A domain-containing protein n=1 Tax=Dyadobacter psychrophilus TaxID=651661 RepID=A0A1T5DUP5_9BACT|nr:choice-of-anchor A family protein [Dyadobacter psychrophilus]SKB75123.1 Por secretion system C-terminal sorting domain-containing protein/choice-of-anchor A domain-containing protein [Dyadobacter psychrophilus]
MSAKLLLVTLLASITLNLNDARAQSPTAAAKRFNIFVKGDATFTSDETEGPVAIGGNLTTNQYQISFNKNHGVFFVGGASIGLAVRGGVKLSSGSLTVNGDNYVKIGQCAPSDANTATPLRIWYKDNNNAESTIRITGATAGYSDTPNITINASVNTWSPKVGDSENPICENVFGTGANQIDIDGAFTTFIKRSNQLKDMKDNLAIRDQNGNIITGMETGPYLDPSKIGNNPKIIVDPNAINVLTVSAAVWDKIGNTNIERIPQGPQLGDGSYTGPFALIINIVDFPTFAASKGNNPIINFPGVGGLSDPQGSYVIYNFPDATDKLVLGGNTPIHGTIFAPCANLIKENNGNINGQIIAKSFVHTRDEVHFWPFLPSIPEPVEKAIEVNVVSKCINNAPWLEYTITPNYPATGETAKIEWLNSENNVIQEDTERPLTGSILFPGAAVDENGAGIAWPGWEKDGEKWVEVTDRYSSILDDGAKVRITVTPWKVVEITYPVSDGKCYTSPPPSGSLPVTLASFTARNENCDIQLQWTVTEAKDFSHFVVQRSTDAKNFVSLNRVNYSANQNAYAYNDSPYSREIAPSKNYYYRLQQVDTDETFEYSAIRSVEAGTCDARLSVDFYPNPTQDEVIVKSYSPVKKLEILTSGGKQVYQTLPNQDQTELKVNIQAFATGMYIVNIVNAEGKYSSKIVKK